METVELKDLDPIMTVYTTGGAGIPMSMLPKETVEKMLSKLVKDTLEAISQCKLYNDQVNNMKQQSIGQPLSAILGNSVFR